MLKYAQALIFIFYFLIHSEVNAQWVQTKGPNGAYASTEMSKNKYAAEDLILP